MSCSQLVSDVLVPFELLMAYWGDDGLDSFQDSVSCHSSKPPLRPKRTLSDWVRQQGRRGCKARGLGNETILTVAAQSVSG